MPLLAQAASGTDLWPLAILALSVGLIVLLITVARLHAFFALALAACSVGILSPSGSLPGESGEVNHWVYAVELATKELGTMTGKIALVTLRVIVCSFSLQP